MLKLVDHHLLKETNLHLAHVLVTSSWSDHAGFLSNNAHLDILFCHCINWISLVLLII